MVKLIFNPNEPSQNAVSSKSTIYQPKNLNPFDSFEPVVKIEKTKPTKDLVGLENTRYIINQWYYSSLTDRSKQFLLIISGECSALYLPNSWPFWIYRQYSGNVGISANLYFAIRCSYMKSTTTIKMTTFLQFSHSPYLLLST